MEKNTEIGFATKLENPPCTSSSLAASQKEFRPTLRSGLVSLMPIRRCGMKRKGLKIGGGLPGKTMVNPKE
jgi:hypothetical protein